MFRYTIPILLLATSGLQAQKLCKTYQQKVEIQLGKGSTANPDPACVASAAKQGQVRWCSDVGDFAVSFDSDQQSPFPPGNLLIVGNQRGCSRWIQVKVIAAGEQNLFKYRSQVNPHRAIDPQVEVEPGQ